MSQINPATSESKEESSEILEAPKPKAIGPPPRIMKVEPVPELQRILGNVVFIDWPKGTKGTPKKWGRLRLSDMTPEYLAKLPKGNIGVALGKVSNGLCVVDIDADKFLQPFIDANPLLANTFQTHGNRGRSFWFRLNGICPNSYYLKSPSGEDVGEFRCSDGSKNIQCIVHGIHPDSGKAYQWLTRHPVVQVDLKEIVWPDCIADPFSCENPTKNPEGNARDDLGFSVGKSVGNSVGNFLRDFPYTSMGESESGRVGKPRSDTLEPSEDFLKAVEDAIKLGIAGGGKNHSKILPRVVGRFLSLLGLKTGKHLPFAQKNLLAERFYAELKAKGLVAKSKSHYTNDMIATLNNPKITSSNPVPFALARARSDETTDDLRSAEVLFEDENGRDEDFILYLRWCYFMHVETDFGDWGISQRHVAKEIFGEEEPHYKTVGAWQEVLVGRGVIELVGDYVKGKLSRRYRWIWEASTQETHQ